jgi:ribose transport system substrate-binding protein
MNRSWKLMLPIAAAGLATLAACSSSGSGSAPASGKNITIGFVPSLASDPFFISMEYGAEQEAKALGVKLIWQGASGTYSPSAQLPYVNAVLAEHPDAFILVPTDASALLPSVQQAKSMGIPVLTVDTTVTDTSLLASHITGDNVGGGAQAAKTLVSAMGGKGQVYFMNGNPGVTTDQLRQQGFVNQVKSMNGVTYEGLQYTSDEPSKAESETGSVLTRFPNLGGFFAVDDESTVGLIQGLKAAHVAGKVKAVAYDAEPPEVAALRSGELTGLVAQRPGVEGALAVEYAYDAVMHKTSGIHQSVIVPDIALSSQNLTSSAKWFYCTSTTSCSITWQPTSADGAP